MSSKLFEEVEEDFCCELAAWWADEDDVGLTSERSDGRFRNAGLHSVGAREGDVDRDLSLFLLCSSLQMYFEKRKITHQVTAIWKKITNLCTFHQRDHLLFSKLVLATIPKNQVWNDAFCAASWIRRLWSHHRHCSSAILPFRPSHEFSRCRRHEELIRADSEWYWPHLCTCIPQPFSNLETRRLAGWLKGKFDFKSSFYKHRTFI